MKKYLIYGKHEDSIYSIVNGEEAVATQMVRKLRIIHPLEEFYIAPLPGQTEERLYTERLEYFLKDAIRV